METKDFEFIYKGENIPLRIDLDNLNDPRTKMILLIRERAKVLEFGCNTGFCSKLILERGCEVTGVEMEAASAHYAKRFCKKVIVANVEKGEFEKQIGSDKFNNILLGGFVEHLSSPANFLRRIKSLLKEDGSIILYVPNIAHWSIRMELLKGNFNYEATGILDDTHLVHFTKASLIKMLNECGYEVVHIDSVIVPIAEEQVREDIFTMNLNCYEEIIEHFKKTDAESYIYVAEARPA